MKATQSYTRLPSNLMDRLPNELLADIREVYPTTDLVFHVRFYEVSGRTAALIDSDHNFWSRLCHANGLGRLSHETSAELDWKQIAFDCERHARTCRHPGCGTARLTENGTRFFNVTTIVPCSSYASQLSTWRKRGKRRTVLTTPFPTPCLSITLSRRLFSATLPSSASTNLAGRATWLICAH